MAWGEEEEPGDHRWGESAEGSSWGAGLPHPSGDDNEERYYEEGYYEEGYNEEGYNEEENNDDRGPAIGWGQQRNESNNDGGRSNNNNTWADTQRGSSWGDPVGGGWGQQSHGGRNNNSNTWAEAQSGSSWGDTAAGSWGQQPSRSNNNNNTWTEAQKGSSWADSAGGGWGAASDNAGWGESSAPRSWGSGPQTDHRGDQGASSWATNPTGSNDQAMNDTIQEPSQKQAGPYSTHPAPPALPSFAPGELFREAPTWTFDEEDGRDGMSAEPRLISLIDAAEEDEQIDVAMLMQQWQRWQQQQQQDHPDLVVFCVKFAQLGYVADYDDRIKVPRGRMGATGAISGGSSFPQAPSGDTGGGSGGGNGGFNSPAAFPASGGGFTGKLFSIPGQQSADTQPSPSMMGASGMGSTGFNSGSPSFNFGASTAASGNMFGANPQSQSNTGNSQAPFTFGSSNAQPAAAFGGANANPFGSQAPAQNAPNLFGAGNAQSGSGIFGSSTGAPSTASPSMIFGQPKESAPASTAASATNIFGTANNTPQTDTSNPFKSAAAPSTATAASDTQTQNTPTLFGSIGQGSGFKPVGAPAVSAADSQSKTAPNLFGSSTGKSNTANLFNFAASKPTETPASSATPSQSLFSQPKPNPTGNIFGSAPATSAPAAASTPAAPAAEGMMAAAAPAVPAEPNAPNPFAALSSSKPLFGVPPSNETVPSPTPQAPSTSTASLFAGSASAVAPSIAQHNNESNASKAAPPSQTATSSGANNNSWVPNPKDPDGGFWTPGKAAPPSLFSVMGQQRSEKAVESPQKAPSPMQTSPSPAVTTTAAVAAPTMPTLNSPAAPSAASLTVNSIDDIYMPESPSNYNDEQRAQWPIAWKLKALLDWFCMSMARNANDQGKKEILIEYYLRETERIKIPLKRSSSQSTSTGINKALAPSSNKGSTSQSSAAQPNQHAASAASLFGASSASTLTPTPAPSFSGGSLFGATKPAVAGGSSTSTGLSSASSLFGATGNKRKPESQEASQEGSDDTAQSDARSKKSRTGDVAYPSLPEPATSSTSSAPPASVPAPGSGFAIPNLGGTASGTNFFAQFGAEAKKAEAEAAKRRKAAEYDSEEEDEETWEKRDAEKQAAEKARIEKISKDASLGFKIPGMNPSKPSAASLFGSSTGTPSAAAMSPSPAPATSAGGSLFSKSVPASASSGSSQTSNLFAASVASSAGKPASLFSKPSGGSDSNNQPAEKAEAPKAPLFSFGSASKPAATASGSLFSTPGSSASVLPAQKALPSSFSFSQPAQAPAPGASLFGSSFAAKPAASLGTSLFGGSSKGFGTSGSGGQVSKPSASTGSLFDRVDKDKDGNVIKEATDNTFKGDSSTPIKFSKPLPNTLAPPSVASDTSRATTPATVGDDTDNAAPAAEDDAAPAEKQLDLTQSAVGEEDEDVLCDLRSKASELVKGEDGKTEWKVRGVGQLKLLKHKESGKTRIVLRSSPAAKIVLNTSLVAKATYESSGAKKNNIRLPVPTAGGHIGQWVIMVKDAKDAQDLASKMNDNKEY